MMASSKGHTACVELLLQHGANSNLIKDYYNETALMMASSKGHTACVELLLQHGANSNLKDQHNETALMRA